MRTYWFRTNDPDLVVCVPSLADGEITIVDRNDPEQVAEYNPPEDIAFYTSSLVSTLKEEAEREVRQVIADWATFIPGLEAYLDRMVVPFS